MKVHHLNCISSCPLGGHMMDGITPTSFERAHICNHCLLIEGAHGLTLVDTGFGLRDVANPSSRLSSFFLFMNKPDFIESLTAIRQIEKLGFKASDVRDIVLTHLDFDHAGGLDDFPEARVHMLDLEKRHAEMRKTWLDRQRFRPQQWNYKQNWQTYSSASGDTWNGFEKVTPITELHDDIALIPLVGHTHGHAGVAVKSERGWMLHAGDAYFHRDEMNFKNPSCTPGMRMYQTLMEKDRKSRLQNQDRLRALKKNLVDEIDLFCAHDPIELENMQQPSIRNQPAPDISVSPFDLT
ncbi:MBL fold metallo-hydrolase [Bdellovibrio sp. HCB185ZH]|uniref:MBL fold metallo-hydrolase n=1 Tax=Bdellovibrio sp. HCB185ZH TaxID=3394235 RepID=UPI0039A54151